MNSLNKVFRLICSTFPNTKLSRDEQISIWPTAQEIIITCFLTVLLIAIDICFSSQIGLLSYPPGQDGISYMGLAKQIFYQSRLNLGWSWFQQPAPILSLVDLVSNTFLPAPLWYVLMLLSFLIFGEGEWQCYTVRFWPTFLLLLLVVWVIRRRGTSLIAWLCVTLTALLPTVSVGLRSSARDYFTGQVGSASNFASNGYLADLRPDLLFAVLLLWAVVPLVEHVHSLNRRSLLVSGTFAGLAVLCKTSASPMFLLAWGLALLYVLVVNRKKLLSTLLTCLWGMLPFLILLTPYVLAGGAKRTFDYLLTALTSGRILYSNPNATLLSKIGFYWSYFPAHMGQLEGWLLFGTGLLSFLLAWIKLRRTDSRLLAYLSLSAALYALLSVTPNKNFFVGLPYYLLLWLFSLIALTPVLLWASKNRYRVLFLAFTGLYFTVTVTGGFYALQKWPAEYKKASLTNRINLQRIAKSLQAQLNQNDCFVSADYFQYNSYIYYNMINSKVIFYKTVVWDTSNPPQAMLPFMKDEVSKCKAVLVYKEDMEEVSKYLVFAPPVTWSFFRAVAEKVRRPASGYHMLKQYQLSFNSSNLRSHNRRNLTIEMYIKQ